ncbi:hypothetical protein [Pseudomonas sp. nanlin1]|uniref:hypothetical protein n=1 Tax=Pseudomonas sp. nanlin1 TaxID=3040605 RepID=UPI00388F847E
MLSKRFQDGLLAQPMDAGAEAADHFGTPFGAAQAMAEMFAIVPVIKPHIEQWDAHRSSRVTRQVVSNRKNSRLVGIFRFCSSLYSLIAGRLCRKPGVTVQFKGKDRTMPDVREKFSSGIDGWPYGPA